MPMNTPARTRARTHVFALALAALGAGSTGCTEIFAVDFTDPFYVAGMNPQGGTPAGPTGDIILTEGDVTVSANTNGGLAQHIRLNGTTNQVAVAEFIPTPTGPEDHYLVSFLGSKQSNQPGVTFIMVYGEDAMGHEVYLCSFAIAASKGAPNGAWAAVYYADGKGLEAESFKDTEVYLDVPHRVNLRINRAAQTVFASYTALHPSGATTSDEVEVAFDAPFTKLSKVRAYAEGATGDYRLQAMHMSAWSSAEQSRVVDTARRYGLLRSPYGQDATLAEEQRLLDTAFAASPAELRRWLPTTTIEIIDAIRP